MRIFTKTNCHQCNYYCKVNVECIYKSPVKGDFFIYHSSDSSESIQEALMYFKNTSCDVVIDSRCHILNKMINKNNQTIIQKLIKIK